MTIKELRAGGFEVDSSDHEFDEALTAAFEGARSWAEGDGDADPAELAGIGESLVRREFAALREGGY